MEIRYFGIRHHGPGSARNLEAALNTFRPQCILIELPADALEVLEWVNHPKLEPPVALLLYSPKDFTKASYLPFALFSPEWRALTYAFKNAIEVVPMDLPMHFQFSLSVSDGQIEFFERSEFSRIASRSLELDPLRAMAELAGYSDTERWWEMTFERTDQTDSIFEAIGEMMNALRNETQRQESRETLLREAFMRKALRQAAKKPVDRIAVVCGAWHVPAIKKWQQIPAKTDNSSLKGLKKIKTAATWIPWGYNRLAKAAGYGAGVLSPAWYELLYQDRSNSHTIWMSKAARLMRAEDLPISAAHAVEASRLAVTLAALRGLANPGLDELQEAVQSVFTMGDSKPLALIHERLTIGDRQGNIPDDLPRIPLQQDFEKQIRSARLTEEYKTTRPLTKELDLRKPANLKASLLLHRLDLLDIPWGQLRAGSEEQKGGFKEVWRLKWKADYAIRIIEAGMWGNTVEEAASRFIVEKASEMEQLGALSPLLYRVLAAELPEALKVLIRLLEDRAAISPAIRELMVAIPPLVQVLRYGDVRGTDIVSVEELIKHSLPRIFLGLPALASQIDDTLAKALFQELIQLNHSLGLLRWPKADSDWEDTLLKLMDQQGVHSLLQGFSARMLLDRGNVGRNRIYQVFQFALSDNQEAAIWLEGFLFGSGLLLIRQRALWDLLDQWIQQLPEQHFQEVLPILRRTFAHFTASERSKMMFQAKQDKEETPPDLVQWDEELLAISLPSIRKQL